MLRFTTDLPAADPLKATAALQFFLDHGKSAHTERAATLPPILEYARDHKIPFALFYAPGEGYLVTRAQTTEFTVPTLPADTHFVIRDSADSAEERTRFTTLRVSRMGEHAQVDLFNRGGNAGSVRVLESDLLAFLLPLIPPARWDVEVTA